MQELLGNLSVFIDNLLVSLGMYGAVLGSILILVESILPILPLSVFITLNFVSFGHLAGFLISYLLTVVGCNLAFYLSKRVMKGRFNYLQKKFDQSKILNLTSRFSRIKFPQLVLLMAFPFTPAFLINIASGVVSMDQKKFLLATLIGKPFMVYFWGRLGVTLIESLTHPEYLVKVLAMMLISYVASKFLSKKLKIE